MKILHVLFLALCLLSAGQAAAQDIFVLENERTLNPLVEEKAITDIHEYAKSYYEDCNGKQNGVFSAETQDLFCACMSANIAEVLTPADVSDIRKNNEKGAIQRELLKKFLYVRCTIQPVYGVILNGCLDDKELKATLYDHTGSCKCVAVEMTNYWRDHGLQIASDPSELKHSATEPLIRFLLSKAYNRQMEYVAKVCAYPEGQRFEQPRAKNTTTKPQR